jgi:hypothetical protein
MDFNTVTTTHSFYIVALLISLGTPLFAKALPSNGRVYLLIKNLLLISEYCFVARLEAATQQRLYTLQYILTLQTQM